MAENKKSFLLYCDLIYTIEKLTDEQAGKLLKHTLRYVNDLNPTPEDILTEVAFEPIKQSLKRDLIKYEGIRIKNKESADKRWAMRNDALASVRIPTDAKNADSDSDSDSDSDKDKDKKNKRKSPAPIFIPPTIEKVKEYFKEKGFSLHTAETAFYYYENLGWSDSKGNKIVNWKNKMILVWMKEEAKIKPQSSQLNFPR